jgi:hypothetical protein
MGMFQGRPILISAGKSVAASIVMGAVLYFLQATWLGTPPGAGTGGAAWDLFLLILTGSIVYFFTAWAFRCPEVSSVREVLRPLLRRR